MVSSKNLKQVLEASLAVLAAEQLNEENTKHYKSDKTSSIIVKEIRNNIK